MKFKRLKYSEQALTFDDVLLVPTKSAVLPTDTDTKTKLTKNISLNMPLVSAAMDTVTESELAIAIALEGGIGVIHRNLSIKEQASKVAKVKRFESGFVKEPVTVAPDTTINELHGIITKVGFSGIPVTKNGSPNGVLVGMITNRDYSIKKHTDFKVKDRMTEIKDMVIAKKGISLDESYELLLESKRGKIVVVDPKTGRLDSLVTRTDIDKSERFPNSCKDAHKRLRVGAAVGPHDMKRINALIKAGADVIVIDTAHGHSVNVINGVKKIKKISDIDVIAGNVVTEDATEALISAGADAVKVGMGPGSICITRVIAGVGVPQITAVYNCYKAAKKYDIPIISDGGVRYSGDIAKALAAGASSVMIGSLFAGTEQTPGRTVFIQGRKYKKYRGMGSLSAMEAGSKSRYFQDSISDSKKLVPEGVEGIVPYRGHLSEVVYQLIGGLRSSMGYCGVKNIKELQTKTQFVQISPVGSKESHPSNVTITDEAPNYSTQ